MWGPSHWGQRGTLVRAVLCKVYPKETGVARPEGTRSLVAVLTTLPGPEICLDIISFTSPTLSLTVLVLTISSIHIWTGNHVCMTLLFPFPMKKQAQMGLNGCPVSFYFRMTASGLPPRSL